MLAPLKRIHFFSFFCQLYILFQGLICTFTSSMAYLGTGLKTQQGRVTFIDGLLGNGVFSSTWPIDATQELG